MHTSRMELQFFNLLILQFYYHSSLPHFYHIAIFQVHPFGAYLGSVAEGGLFGQSPSVGGLPRVHIDTASHAEAAGVL